MFSVFFKTHIIEIWLIISGLIDTLCLSHLNVINHFLQSYETKCDACMLVCLFICLFGFFFAIKSFVVSVIEALWQLCLKSMPNVPFFRKKKKKMVDEFRKEILNMFNLILNAKTVKWTMNNCIFEKKTKKTLLYITTKTSLHNAYSFLKKHSEQ